MQSIARFAAIAATVLLVSTSGAFAQEAADEVTIALSTPLDNADPCNISKAYIGNVIRENVVETLTLVDPQTGQVKPRLAESWELMPNGVWRFKLRPGVVFHDGAAFDASAVVTAINRMRNPSLSCQDRSKVGKSTWTLTIVDPLTLDIATEPHEPILPISLSYIGMSSPATDTTSIIRDPVGTGPYVMKSWDASTSIVLERNEKYWGTKPTIRKATYVWRGESSVRSAMVPLGEADIALDIAPQDATDPKLDAAFLNAETTRIGTLTQHPPLNDLRVRKALNLSVDRQSLIGTILSPKVVIATQYMPPNISGYNPNIKPWPYDPAAAKKLLDEARKDGVPVDTPIRLVGRTGQYPNNSEVLQTIAQMWKAIGLDVRVEMLEPGQFSVLNNPPYPAPGPILLEDSHDNNTGDAGATLQRYMSDDDHDELHEPALDAVLKKALVASGDERRQLLQEASRMISEDYVPAVFLFHMVSYMRIGPRVDYTPPPGSTGMLLLEDMKFKS